jgi:glutathione S-transferase
MLRLHYFPPMCSIASMTALELAGAPYEAVFEDMAGDQAGLRAVSVLGQIPVLETDEGTITDTIAIIYWLSRRFPDAALLPTDTAGLTSALSKMGWFGSHLHIVRRRYYLPALFGAPASVEEEMRAVALPIYWKALQQVDAWIGDTGLGGAGIEAYALLFYHWAAMDRLPIHELRGYSRLAARLMEHTGVRRALALHDSPLLAIA